MPEEAWRKARQAYGSAVDEALEKATARLGEPAWLEACLRAMHMDLARGAAVSSALAVEQARRCR